MSIEYNGEHQICFWRKVFNPSPYVVGERYMTENPKFSWDDFHLIPLTRPFISASKPHYTLVTIPNSSKRVNITDFLSGGLTYESRTGEWEFAIDHDKWGNWVVSHHELEDFFNGSKMLVSLNDDPTKIYEGRITLKEYDAGESYSTIKMAYNLDPDELSSAALANVLFRVRFLDKRNNVLQGILSGYGSAPYYPDTAPSEEGQTFKNWSPVPSAVTGNTDYTPVYDKTGGAYNGPPVRIEIVTPPTKVQYTYGEMIDITGIVVKAYMDNDEEWGVVPIREITISPNKAIYNPETDSRRGESVLDGITIPYTFANGYRRGNVMYRASNNVVYIIRDNAYGEGRWDVYAKSPYYYQWKTVDSDTWYDNTMMYVGGNYYHNGSGATPEDYAKVSDVTSITQGMGDMRISEIIFEGVQTIKPTGSPQIITVSWPRPSDNRLLRTTFEISVALSLLDSDI